MKKIRTKVGVVGCGAVSDIYLGIKETFDLFEIVACADLDIKRAYAQAKKYAIAVACNATELLKNSDIQIVLNLTPPQTHAEISLSAIYAGKSIYSEKPLATNIEDGRKILDEAKKRKLHVGCAPDTFLGGGLQTCRKIIDDGLIGEPIAATAFMMNHGYEHWHPTPEFYYEKGGGPMFDMGPYYITALVTLLGSAQRVTGSTKTTFPKRLITSQPKNNKEIIVETPTHITGIIDFANGVTGTVITSFDLWSSQESHLEIYGTEGTLRLPDPNSFDCIVRIWRPRTNKWEDVPLTHSYVGNNYRGLGLADMINGIVSNQPYRANGELAYHVLEIMLAFHKSCDQNRHIKISSTCCIPAPLPQETLDIF